MKNMKITLFLDNYAVLSANPLDGIMAKLWFEEEKRKGIFDGDFFKQIPFIEYDREGFYHISNPVFNVNGIANQSLHKIFDVDMYVKSMPNPKITKGIYEMGRGAFKAHVAYFEKKYIKEVVFYARGDMERFHELLHGLNSVGKKSSYSWGKISKILIEEINEDCSVVCDGKLMRHVPQDSRFLGSVNQSTAVRLMQLTHPYWDRGRESYCAIPASGAKKGSTYSQNALTKNPPLVLANLFGLKENFKKVENKKITFIEDNSECKCLMCGRIQAHGYMDPSKQLLGPNTNAFYDYVQPASPFLCTSCHYAYTHYKVSMQKDLNMDYGDMANIILFEDYFEAKNFNSDEANELYDIFINPPKEAFAILLKAIKGNTFEIATYKYIPTVDSELIVVNYGTAQFFTPRVLTLECIKHAERIFKEGKKRKVKISEDVLFNRALKEDYNHWFTDKLRSDAWFMSQYEEFMNLYSYDVRFVAKMMLKRHRIETKES